MALNCSKIRIVWEQDECGVIKKFARVSNRAVTPSYRDCLGGTRLHPPR